VSARPAEGRKGQTLRRDLVRVQLPDEVAAPLQVGDIIGLSADWSHVDPC
jgi:hypothetical protein